MTASPPPPCGRRAVVAILVVAGLAVVTLLALALRSTTSAETIEVVVPAGTIERIEAGEPVELLPRVLRVEVGDRLVIRNHDEVAHQVGPYTVAAGQVLSQHFTTPGTIEGLCTLHPSGEISIVVT